ncbi:MAG: alkaline phosphatase family protein [Planctomycetota bacterium]|jgi:predicted AlkP superfamily phosphohydrolase/phosphomutase
MTGPQKVVCLSIDGVPHGLLGRLMAAGHMPAMADLCARHGQPRMMRSVHPTVSCVAWACYATGRNPGKHGIFGFLDRRPGTYELSLPNAANLRGPHIWEVFSAAGKKVFGMNVPGTYPPRAVNGVLIGGFLTPALTKAAYPPEVSGYLESIDYRIDSDAALARESKARMLDDLDVTLARRAQALFHFLGADEWDFFHAHIMGTDRINHFLLAQAEQDDPTFAPGFQAYYRKVDDVIGRLVEAVGDETPLMILSDHGFCPIRYEVQLSRHLIDAGWTTPAREVRSPLSFEPARTRAYTLIPGRIYVNVAGREPGGIVPVEEYDRTRHAVAADLLALRDPDGRPVIRKVVRREELYWPEGRSAPDPAANTPGGLPPYAQGPDLVAIPHDGYDLKMGLIAPEVFTRTQLEGMHTCSDALCFARGVELPAGDLEIRQLAGPICRALGVETPAGFDLDPVPEPAGIT